jgi:four helix bundle protein
MEGAQMTIERNRHIRTHGDLEVYQRGMDAAMKVFELSKAFPKTESYALTDQIRRSSRSVCANLAEAWRKRRYAAAFVSKLSDAETEAAETQVWLEFAVKCGYLNAEQGRDLYRCYDDILRTLVGIINHPDTWVLKSPRRSVTPSPRHPLTPSLSS